MLYVPMYIKIKTRTCVILSTYNCFVFCKKRKAVCTICSGILVPYVCVNFMCNVPATPFQVKYILQYVLTYQTLHKIVYVLLYKHNVIYLLRHVGNVRSPGKCHTKYIYNNAHVAVPYIRNTSEVRLYVIRLLYTGVHVVFSDQVF